MKDTDYFQFSLWNKLGKLRVFIAKNIIGQCIYFSVTGIIALDIRKACKMSLVTRVHIVDGAVDIKNHLFLS